jgi:hypothetical protein
MLFSVGVELVFAVKVHDKDPLVTTQQQWLTADRGTLTIEQ